MGNNELWGKIIKSAISLPGVNVDSEINLENAISILP